MHTHEITGEEVIGLPGQGLTALELRALVGLADGQAPSALAAALSITPAALRGLEASLKGKLGAKTHPHLISRGFMLGVLASRALVLLLAISCTLGNGSDLMRPRPHQRSRASSHTSSLTLRAGRTGSAGRGHSTPAHLA